MIEITLLLQRKTTNISHFRGDNTNSSRLPHKNSYSKLDFTPNNSSEGTIIT
jgi:hypothetical protein